MSEWRVDETSPDILSHIRLVSGRSGKMAPSVINNPANMDVGDDDVFCVSRINPMFVDEDTGIGLTGTAGLSGTNGLDLRLDLKPRSRSRSQRSADLELSTSDRGERSNSSGYGSQSDGLYNDDFKDSPLSQATPPTAAVRHSIPSNIQTSSMPPLSRRSLVNTPIPTNQTRSRRDSRLSLGSSSQSLSCSSGQGTLSTIPEGELLAHGLKPGYGPGFAIPRPVWPPMERAVIARRRLDGWDSNIGDVTYIEDSLRQQIDTDPIEMVDHVEPNVENNTIESIIEDRVNSMRRFTTNGCTNIELNEEPMLNPKCCEAKDVLVELSREIEGLLLAAHPPRQALLTIRENLQRHLKSPHFHEQGHFQDSAHFQSSSGHFQDSGSEPQSLRSPEEEAMRRLSLSLRTDRKLMAVSRAFGVTVGETLYYDGSRFEYKTKEDYQSAQSYEPTQSEIDDFDMEFQADKNFETTDIALTQNLPESDTKSGSKQTRKDNRLGQTNKGDEEAENNQRNVTYDAGSFSSAGSSGFSDYGLMEEKDRVNKESEAHRNKPSIWEMYYKADRNQDLKATRPNKGKKLKATDVPYYPAGGRPEADFTLDMPRAELLTRKMKAGKRLRCQCRLLASLLGLIFFLLTVMAVSLVLTRGRRMFGSMV